MNQATIQTGANKKDLKFFMRDATDEIVDVPAPKSFKDEEGNPITMQVKTLTNERMQQIQDNYRKRKVATNKQGSPYIGANNEVMFQTDYDHRRAMRHIIAEALVYPDLSDKELMQYYKCNDISEMPQKVFRNTDEYRHVSQMVLNVLGLGDAPSEEEDNAIIDNAKN